MKLIHGNCYDELKNIPNNSIDFILVDPPYKLENHGGGKSEFAQRKLVKDTHINFISNGFNMNLIFSEIQRVCKIVNLVVFCSNKQISKIMSYWENLGFSTTLLVWDKPNPVPFGNGKYISNLEFMVYVRGKNCTYNNTGYATQLKTFKYSSPSSKKRKHPTEKPVELLERLLRIHTNENDIVLDMFAGSGTTGVACKNLNRDFIGIEQLQEYFDVMSERLMIKDKKSNKFFDL